MTDDISLEVLAQRLNGHVAVDAAAEINLSSNASVFGKVNFIDGVPLNFGTSLLVQDPGNALREFGANYDPDSPSHTDAYVMGIQNLGQIQFRETFRTNFHGVAAGATVILTAPDSNFSGYGGSGTAYLQLGQPDKALADADHAVELVDTPTNLWLRGDILLRQERWDAAISDFEAARIPDDRLVKAYQGRARWHSAAGRMKQAAADERRAEELSRQ